PALNSIRIQETIATLKRELNEKQNLPDLTTGITYSIVGPTTLNGAVSQGQDALGVKVGFNLPIWFKRNKARVEAARQTERAVQVKAMDVENKITESVESILADLDQIDATVDLYSNRLIPEADQMLSSAYAAYKTGKISFLDLLDSERMVVNLRLDYEQVVAQQRIGESNLRKAVGLLEIEE
ncbi:MAG: TolC family protein, partial [Fidelibacterota bacterium]